MNPSLSNPVALDYATPAAPSRLRPADIASTVAWTAAGVGTLILLFKGVNAVGSAAGLPYACWQMTGARAAAVTASLGTLVAIRRGHIALFGILYGAYLAATHFSYATLSSAVIAGIVAWMVALSLRDRAAMPIRLIASLLTFNALLTLGTFFSAKQTWTTYSTGLGLRMLATLIVCAAIVGIAKLVRPGAVR